VLFAVENMYPLRAGGQRGGALTPRDWDPTALDVPSITLDFPTPPPQAPTP